MLRHPQAQLKRSADLRRVLTEGAAWERSTTSIIAALPNKKFKKKRIGNRAAKNAEKLLDAKDAFGP